jgi:serine/threonine protein kinase
MSSYLALRNDFSSRYQHFIKIGEGSFSTVYKAKSKDYQEYVGIKVNYFFKSVKQINKTKLPFGAIDYMQ